MSREILLFIGGVGVLYFGAEWLVRGSARLASSLGVSPIVLGLTVVSMGTSAPELVVSVVAAVGGHGDLAIGYVMGSNLANIGLVLGLSAIMRPLNLMWQCTAQSPGLSEINSTVRVWPTATRTVDSGHSAASGISPPSVSVTRNECPCRWIG